MANAIFSSYAKDFLVSWKSLFAGSGSSPSTPWAIILASFSTSLISNILSSVIFLAAVVCVFIVTMLQPFLWLFTYYCGPICLAFAVCDMTVHIARNWLNMFLIVNFVGIFGSISFVVAQAAGLVSDFGVGTSGNNIILVAVYGTMSIVFFCLIWPITGYIFSGYSPVGNVATPQGAIGAAATGAIAYGAVMAGTGSLLSKHGGDNSILGKIGDGLKSHGTAIMNNASNTSRVMKGWAPQREGSQSRGSQQQSSSIPLNQSNTTEKQPSNTAK
jgi:hypothetical protein